LAGAVFFNDGTTNRIAASQRDTGGEIDVYHGDTGGTTLTNTTTLDAVTGTSPQTTSTDLIYKNFGSGNRLGLIWSEANVVKYRITNQASPAFTWATEVALLSGLTDTDVCPQWVTGFGGIGALYQDNGSVKVEWVVSPSFGGGGGFAFSQAVIIA
ncbi:MAG TPA: hypothetical protein VLA89_14045, partial [Gemmatimonadales bacterium]|nr:hypothetical protein [Gemmatimonadales bacterium]